MGYLGNKPADSYLTLEKQTFTTSATDTYTLDRAVSSVNDIELFLNNVRQEPTEAYTISGTTLTLASAITASDSMYCIYQGRSVGTQAPATGSVTNAMLAGSINESKLLGSIPNSKLANSSITVNGTSISLGASGTISAGIENSDSWVLTTSFSVNTGNNDITSNLARYTQDGVGYLGTGMSESSGVFTFPSTGIWLILAKGYFYRDSAGQPYVGVLINTTTNGSSFDIASGSYSWMANTTNAHCSNNTSFIFDVQNTSTHKVKFSTNANIASITSCGGNTNMTQTSFQFIRLGDT